MRDPIKHNKNSHRRCFTKVNTKLYATDVVRTATILYVVQRHHKTNTFKIGVHRVKEQLFNKKQKLKYIMYFHKKSHKETS